MRSYQITSGGGLESISLGEHPLVSLDKRHFWIIEGKYHRPDGEVLTPLSDRCGTVIEASAAFRHLQSGEHFGKVVIEMSAAGEGAGS
jgi:hypothetical protein